MTKLFSFVFTYVLIFLSFSSLVYSQLQRDTSIIIPEPYYKDLSFFPEEIKEKFAEYTSLAEKTETCNLINLYDSYPETIFEKTIEKACMPDYQTLILFLEEGQIELVKYLIENVYLPNDVDPSDIINSWISKNEARMRQVASLSTEVNLSELKSRYSFINFDNRVSFIVKFQEDGILPDKISVNCYKDSISMNFIFNKKGQKLKFKDSKKLYDEVESNCSYNFNSYGMEVEINLIKKNKLKKWETIFKK